MSSYNLRLLPGRKVKLVIKNPFVSDNLDKPSSAPLPVNPNTNEEIQDELHNHDIVQQGFVPQHLQTNSWDQQTHLSLIGEEFWEEEDYLPLPQLQINEPQAHQLQMDEAIPPPPVPPLVAPPQAAPQFNPMALSFKPSSFNGLHPESANRWWRSLTRYSELAGIQGNDRCNLLGLLLSGSAEIWFNSLPAETRIDFEALEAAFREKFITAAHTQLQRQMAVLSRSQRQGESVDEYVTDARSKMVDYNYDNDLQMTLLINGLRPDIKTPVMQHLPFNNVDELITKARHIESALKTQGILTLPTYQMNLAASSTSVHNAPDNTSPDQLKDFQEVIQNLSEKFEQLSKQLTKPQRFKPPEPRSQWHQHQQINYGRSPQWQKPWGLPQNVRGRPPPTNQKPDLRCWKCGTLGHVQKNCRKYSSSTPVIARTRSPDGRFRSPSPAPRRNFKGN